MSFLSRLFKARATETIRLLSDGFAVDRDGVELFYVRWVDVTEIVTFKRDLITTDCVHLAFRLNDGDTYFDIHEEIDGFGKLADDLPRLFAGIAEDWFFVVVKPAFATNFTRLYGEAPNSR